MRIELDYLTLLTQSRWRRRRRCSWLSTWRTKTRILQARFSSASGSDRLFLRSLNCGRAGNLEGHLGANLYLW